MKFKDVLIERSCGECLLPSGSGKLEKKAPLSDIRIEDGSCSCPGSVYMEAVSVEGDRDITSIEEGIAWLLLTIITALLFLIFL